MTQRKLTEEEVEYLLCEGVLPIGNLAESDSITYKVHDEGKWEDGGKYSHREVIVHSIADDTYWRVLETRSGSYFTDYENYYDTTLVQVEKKEVVTTRWVPVNQEVSVAAIKNKKNPPWTK